jgi:Dyp-type peroxidase family
MKDPLELTDMQRLLIDGLGRWPESKYALLQVNSGQAAAARAWLSTVLPSVAVASQRSDPAAPTSPVIAVAFTFAGLEAIGLTGAQGFLAEFREGMTTLKRRVNLGDPENLRWGRDADSIHLLLMMFSRYGHRDADWKALPPMPWATVVKEFDCFAPKDGREHFGFKDGISQPRIEGSEPPPQTSAAEPAANTIKPGEFILGYTNEAEVLPTSPTVPASIDPHDLLPALPATAKSKTDVRKDFGRNGSYLVFRQLVQDVAGFDAFLESNAPPGLERERLAAKLVGRWRTGAPLVKAPEADRKSLSSDNDFAYYETDRDGHACPLGAHIRRANPRDSLVNEDLGIGPDLAAEATRRHRLLRRGRLFEDGPEKGLLFVCLNANIQDQFELVQHQWLNSPRFAGLDGDVDPLVGPRRDGTCSMTLQAPNGSRQLRLRDFVELVGGGYFFLPGIKALACLAKLP